MGKATHIGIGKSQNKRKKKQFVTKLSLLLPTSPYDALSSPKLSPRWALVSKTAELWGLEGTLLALSTKRGRGAC